MMLSEGSSRDALPGGPTAMGRRHWILDFLAGQRLRPIWICTAILFALFAVVRLGLLLASYGMLADHVGSAEVLRCFLLGVRYDAMPIGYAMGPLVVALTLASPAVFNRRGFRRAVVLYTAAVVTICVGTEGFGVYFFLRFGRRLNYMAFAYLAHLETLQFMWGNYPMWALIPVVPGLFYLCYRVFGRWFGRGSDGPWSPRRRIVTAAVLGALCVLACRGGLERRPLNPGSAYFCGNQLVDQLAMNDFYTMFHAAKSRLTDGGDERQAYRLPAVARAVAVAREMLLAADDEPLDHPANPLWRRSHSRCPRRDLNVVVIVMEGMAGKAVGALGHSPSYTPQFDALCDEGLFFQRMYAVGARTSRAMVATLCGHPDLLATTVMKRDRAIGRFFTLPEILRERGYRTMFIYGGQATFDNMGEFFAAGGIEEVIDQDRMGEPAGNWGVPDEAIFRRAHERFEELAGRRFFAVILTVSNHPPFDVPRGRVEMLPTDQNELNEALNAYRYADWALAEYFRYARGAAYFENTLFVLVSDHGRGLDRARMVDVPGFRIPCLIYAPGIVAPGRVDTVASQTDIPPTLLGLLGGAQEHCFLGRDVLRVAPDDGFALLHEDVYLAFVRGDLALTLPPGPGLGAGLFRVGPSDMTPVDPNDAEAKQRGPLAEQMLSYYTMARHLYLQGAYCRPELYRETTTEPSSRPRPDDER
ncbi:MAG: sulfatase-like hydrolase/transferase [Phycisphaerae bacterium]